MQGNFLHRPVCELCGSSKKKILFRQPFSDEQVWGFLNQAYGTRIDKQDLKGGDYEIVQCLDCGFIWQTQILNDDLMAKLYEQWISADESLQRAVQTDFAAFAGYAREAAVIHKLVGKARKPYQIKVLDFGMGWGYWCLMAKAFGYDVYGFEISQERIDFASKNGVRIISSLAELQTRQFDFINIESVFEHLAKPLGALKMLVRVLKQDGVLRISVPNGHKFLRQIKKPGWQPGLGAMAPLEHISCFPHKTLVDFAGKAGLQLISQPFLLSFRSGLKDYLRGVLGKYYKQHFGRMLYFKKA